MWQQMIHLLWITTLFSPLIPGITLSWAARGTERLSIQVSPEVFPLGTRLLRSQDRNETHHLEGASNDLWKDVLEHKGPNSVESSVAFLHPWPISPPAVSAVLLALCTVAAWKLYHSSSHKQKIQMHFTRTHTHSQDSGAHAYLFPHTTCNSFQVPCVLLKNRNQAHSHRKRNPKQKTLHTQNQFQTNKNQQSTERRREWGEAGGKGGAKGKRAAFFSLLLLWLPSMQC